MIPRFFDWLYGHTTQINDFLAVRATVILGTMWCAYAFVVMCVLPAAFPAQRDSILYVSNCFQLVFLPLLMVGQRLMGASAETRAQDDHEAIMAEFELVKSMHLELHSVLLLEQSEAAASTSASVVMGK